MAATPNLGRVAGFRVSVTGSNGVAGATPNLGRVATWVGLHLDPTWVGLHRGHARTDAGQRRARREREGAGAAGKKKTCCNWQYTADGGKTFVNAPSTPTGKTLVSGLTPLTAYGFRVSVTGSNGVAGEWSPLVTFVVH